MANVFGQQTDYNIGDTPDWVKAAEEIKDQYGPAEVRNAMSSGFFDRFPSYSAGDASKLGEFADYFQQQADQHHSGFGGIGDALTKFVGNPLGNFAFTTPNSTVGKASIVAGAPLVGGAPAGGGMDLGDFADLGESGDLGGLSDAELADILAGGSGTGDVLTGGGMAGGGIMDTIQRYAGSVNDFVKSPVGQLIGKFAPSLLGYLGSRKQTQQIQQQAKDYSEMGAPYRARLADLYANPGSFLTSPGVQIPVQQAADIRARALSTKFGNPALSPNAEQDLNNYTANSLYSRLGEEKDRLAGFGGLTFYNQAAPNAATNAINSQGNEFNALGAGASDIFNPQPTLAQSLYEFKRLMGNT